MNVPVDFVKTIDEYFKNIEIEPNVKEAIKRTIFLNFDEYTATSKLKERLGIFYEYEKNYLTLIKDFKEEIKFVATLQEDS